MAGTCSKMPYFHRPLVRDVVRKHHISDKMTDTIRDVYIKAIHELHPHNYKFRSDRIKRFEDIKVKDFDDESRKILQMIVDKETFHINLMDVAWPQCYKMQYEHDLPPSDKIFHDWTKDEMYMFVTTTKFDCGITFLPTMMELFDAEVNRHYTHEPHHPEYERENADKECEEWDILEMAVDRLIRNCEASGGTVDMENMNIYLPNFFIGGEDAIAKKKDIYIGFVKKYRSDAERVYKELCEKVKAQKL